MTKLTPDAHRRVQHIQRLIGVNEGLFLDVGCGQGLIEQNLQKSGISFIGIDMDKMALEAAKSWGLAVVFANAEKLPFPDNTFDGCISSETLEHFDNFDKAIQEIGRVLKPEATCSITVPYRYCENVVPRVLHKFVYIMYEESEKRWGHVRPGLSLEELQASFDKTGMRLVSTGYDIKVLSAYLMLLWYFLMSKEESSKFWRFWLKVYLKLLPFTAPLYKLDNKFKGRGFTLLAKFQKLPK